MKGIILKHLFIVLLSFSCAAFILGSSPCMAQQLPELNLYRTNANVLNPAALENDYLLYGREFTAEVLSINQLAVDELSPKTSLLRAHHIFGKGTGVKLLAGANLSSDDEGFTETNSISLRLAGILSTNPSIDKLVFGLTAGISQFQIKTDGVVVVDAGDDKAKTNLTQSYPDISIGVFYSRRLPNNDNFYVGFSIPQIFSLDKTVLKNSQEFELYKKVHYTSVIGLHKFLNDDTYIEPAMAIIYSQNFPVTAMMNVRLKWSKWAWLGAGASSQGNLISEFGVFIGKQGSRAENLGVGLVANTPLFGKIQSPFGNTMELRATWTM